MPKFLLKWSCKREDGKFIKKLLWHRCFPLNCVKFQVTDDYFCPLKIKVIKNELKPHSVKIKLYCGRFSRKLPKFRHSAVKAYENSFRMRLFLWNIYIISLLKIVLNKIGVTVLPSFSYLSIISWLYLYRNTGYNIAPKVTCCNACKNVSWSALVEGFNL